jgi:hypothetical protein
MLQVLPPMESLNWEFFNTIGTLLSRLLGHCFKLGTWCFYTNPDLKSL